MAELRKHPTPDGYSEIAPDQLKPGLFVVAARMSDDVVVSGTIYNYSFGKIKYDPVGRFSIMVPGWQFFIPTDKEQ